MLEQYYTRRNIAEFCLALLLSCLWLTKCLMVEPAAGTGSFFNILPKKRRLGWDKEPKCPGIQKGDFLKTKKIPGDQPIAIIGNPPFSLAVEFFNYSARQARFIGFIVPMSFRKDSVVNKLDRNFHLIREVELPNDAFIFRSEPYDIGAIFQVWERRPEERELKSVERRHCDFEFVKQENAHFAVRRNGGGAGRIVDRASFPVNEKAHYFVRILRGDVRRVMAQLDFASVAKNVAGARSISQLEIVALYSAFVARRAARTNRLRHKKIQRELILHLSRCLTKAQRDIEERNAARLSA